MDRLEHVFDPDVAVGVITNTVRRGTKWSKLKPGQVIELSSGPKDHQTVIGYGKVVSAQVGKFKDIHLDIFANNCEPAARSYGGMIASMRRAYGADFDVNEDVTVVTYERIETPESE